MESEIDETTVFYGSGNVFADIGLPNPEELLAKARLASAIQDMIELRRFTQTEAAKIMGIDQPKVSKIIRGRLTEFSTERLLGFLMRLGADVDIVIHKQAPEIHREGTLNIAYV